VYKIKDSRFNPDVLKHDVHTYMSEFLYCFTCFKQIYAEVTNWNIYWAILRVEDGSQKDA
jgi:hypothetical protein